MANTYVDYTATAAQQYFAFNFPYLEDEHVIVEIEGVDQTITTNYTIETSPTQRINLSNPTTALAGGELVRIKRRSAPNTNLVDFQNGSVLTESELDRAYLHNRYLAEEATEGADAGLKELEGSTNFNANNKQIKNLADGTLATDAVNKGYVDTQIALTDTNLAGFYKSTHTGNAVDNVFTLSFTPQTTDAKAYIVSIDGLVQVPDTDYTIGATAITFNTIPANSAEICVVATAAASVATVNEAQVTALGTSDTRSLATWTRDLNSPTATGSTTARSLADRFADVANVLDYGADPTGVTDCTDIFNTITKHTTVHGGNDDLNMRQTILVPPGDYKVDGTVYIRKGQHFKGTGDAPTRILIDPTTDGHDTFVLGQGLIGGVETLDAGGLAAIISDLHVEGGDSVGAVIRARPAGARISDLFLTSSGTAIKVFEGGDTLIHNCFIENGSVGIDIEDCQNVIISDTLFYYMNYGVRVKSDVFDVQMNNCHYEYGKYTDILFNTGSSNVANFQINDCQFLKNIQEPTAASCIQIKSDDSEIAINSCHFRNMKGYAISSTSDANDNSINISDCTFDGNKSNPGYAQSTTAGGISMTEQDVFISGCLFRNLHQIAIKFDNDVSTKQMLVSNCAYNNITDYFIKSTGVYGHIRISGCTGDGVTPLYDPTSTTASAWMYDNYNWLGAVQTSGSSDYFVIPATARTKTIMVKVSANTNSGGNGNYRMTAVYIVSRTVDNKFGVPPAGLEDYIDVTTLHQPTGVNAPTLNATFELDSVGGGVRSTYSNINRNIVVSFPSSYQNAEVEVTYI